MLRRQPGLMGPVIPLAEKAVESGEVGAHRLLAEAYGQAPHSRGDLLIAAACPPTSTRC